VEIFVREQCNAFAGFQKNTPYHLYKDQNDSAPRHVMPADSGDYAGDVSPAYTYDVLKAEESAVLVDVRTNAEWSFVGVPDLSDLGKNVGFVEWVSFPAMTPNEMFLAELQRFTGGDTERAVFFLCRSGQRSKSAAIAATAQGFARAYNIEGGFEGALDAARHRGGVSGWKAAGLPWVQS
jgi:rhodanese-related sulfurtransferase